MLSKYEILIIVQFRRAMIYSNRVIEIRKSAAISFTRIFIITVFANFPYELQINICKVNLAAIVHYGEFCTNYAQSHR